VVIEEAYNGESAVEIVLASKFQYEFIFMDLQMPIMDGYQAVHKLKAYEKTGKINLRGTRIFALSAMTLTQFMTNKDHTLFDKFLGKPVEMQMLKELLK
jgi:CheY-like chemotaxis protein